MRRTHASLSEVHARAAPTQVHRTARYNSLGILSGHIHTTSCQARLVCYTTETQPIFEPMTGSLSHEVRSKHCGFVGDSMFDADNC